MLRSSVPCQPLFFLAGCGGSKKNEVSLSGKVTYPTPDKLVTGGTIVLHPTDRKTPTFPISIKPDGTFSAVGAPLGEMKVTVETESIKGMTASDPYAGRQLPPGVEKKTVIETDTMKVPTYVPIPRKYADVKTTTVKMTIEKGKQVKDINLTN